MAGLLGRGVSLFSLSQVHYQRYSSGWWGLNISYHFSGYATGVAIQFTVLAYIVRLPPGSFRGGSQATLRLLASEPRTFGCAGIVV